MWFSWCPWFFLCASRSHPSWPPHVLQVQKTASYRSSFSRPTSWQLLPNPTPNKKLRLLPFSLIASIANSSLLSPGSPHTFPSPLEKTPNGSIVVTKSTTSQNGTYEDNAQDKVPPAFCDSALCTPPNPSPEAAESLAFCGE